ncbi:Hypothetical predicted protein [Mytilus galloprovincialis]|uniref:Reverse transcriptase domain-containing protein n=1 Tax=Mytilus galloprovincialis TaxID=29158 RepID=A0A8B6CKC3_MYTGA|nr:Hypothetical predicted protein [Mytilus galloprovincialis]
MEQERRHFIEKVEETKLPTDRPVHYIPHHPVAKESSTTPIRIVYDCSCKDGRDNPSLNECLESHPPVMNDITGILMRFRAKKYATTSDLEKAFLQIQLDEKDRDATRFLWLSDPTNTSSPLITYRFKSVLFGATCSPFILSATLLKHFKENPGKLSDTLENGLYVDNILTSFDNENSVIDYYRRSRELLTKGGFNLRSWNSNSPKLQEIASKEQTLDKDELTKILDLLTRGITSDELQQNEMWFSGPKWLNSKEDWPTWNGNNVTSSVCTTMSENDDKIETMENNQNVCIGIGEIIDIERYNSYRKLTRITAYVMRFATNCRAKETERKKDLLRIDEIENAKFLWIRYKQVMDLSMI